MYLKNGLILIFLSRFIKLRLDNLPVKSGSSTMQPFRSLLHALYSACAATRHPRQATESLLLTLRETLCKSLGGIQI